MNNEDLDRRDQEISCENQARLDNIKFIKNK